MGMYHSLQFSPSRFKLLYLSSHIKSMNMLRYDIEIDPFLVTMPTSFMFALYHCDKFLKHALSSNVEVAAPVAHYVASIIG